MTDSQFISLSLLLRLRPGATNDGVRLVLVDDMNINEAAAASLVSYKTLFYAVQRARFGYELAKKVVC